MKKQFSAKDKALVVKAAYRADKTISQISSEHEVHPTQIARWKKTVDEGMAGLFTDKRSKAGRDQSVHVDELHRIIGARDVELEWLKKKMDRFP